MKGYFYLTYFDAYKTLKDHYLRIELKFTPPNY